MNTLWYTTRFTLLIAIVFLVVAGAQHLNAQASDGNLVGAVVDQTGASMPGATVEITNTATGVKSTTTTGTDGAYRFNNVLVGSYDIKFTRTGFASTVLRNNAITLNTTATANAMLTVGDVATMVDVTETAALIDTTTAQVGSTFEQRAIIDIPGASLGLGALNLSLLNAGVASSGGTGAGTGPAVGGQRPRANNFLVEGVDNNRKDVTGRTVAIPTEATQEFTVIQNQASAEFGGGSGGQFNTVMRTGGNQFHGAAFEYLENRNLNALDQAYARSNTFSNPRYDSNTFGGAVGGPILKNKLFFYGLYQYNPTGQSSTPSPIDAPTAAGYSLLDSIPGLSPTNLKVMQQYLPAAASPDGTTAKVLNTTTGKNVLIPLGVLPIVGPSFVNDTTWLINIDYNISAKDQLRGRDINDKQVGFSSLPALPVFYQPRTNTSRLFSLSEFHSFSPVVLNEFRFGYQRYNNDSPAGNYTYPGLDAFPNLFFQDLNAQLGPYPNNPQSTIINTYQLIENVSWTKGRHSMKFGWEGRKYIAPQTFTSRTRGDYEYSSIDLFLRDVTPDLLAQRNVGAAPYSGNAINNSFFAQDQYRLRPNLTVDAGLRYEYHGVAFGDTLQKLNAIASVPGLITFGSPQAATNGWAPRLGIAYSPGTKATTTIRAGFGLSYDKTFDNLGITNKPAELTSTIDVTTATNPSPNFLANGGIRQQTGNRVFTTATAARNATSAYLDDQYVLPYAITWNLGVTHVFHNDYTLEVRYVGTKGVHLPTQNQINIQSKVTPTTFIPTYLTAPGAATLAAATISLGTMANLSKFDPRYAPYFPLAITSFPFIGNSKYNGLAVELTRRFAKGLLFKTAYTWSHAQDDSTADLSTTLLSPRRAQDSRNLTAEWANSFLDRRHRFTQTAVYETPWYKGSQNWFLKNLAGNFILSGTYTYESPQYATVQSGVDSNLNGDVFSDRAIVNTSGVANTGSGVVGYGPSGSPVTSTTACTVSGLAFKGANCIVGYVAQSSTAQYIVAGAGALANGGRQTMATRPINNFDIQIKKAFGFGEVRKLEFAAQFFNFLNHPQYIPGSLNTVVPVSSAATRANLIPDNPAFNRPDLEYSSNPRMIQLTARFQF